MMKLLLTLLFSISLLMSPWTMADSGQAPPAMPVEAHMPKVEDLSLTLKATGNLLAEQSVFMTPESPGRVVSIHHASGDTVKDHEVIIELDDALIQAELKQAQARVEFARQNFQRLDSLANTGSAKASERDESLKQLKVDEASLAYLQARAQQTQLKAPFAGQLGLFAIEVGDYVIPGQQLVTLEAFDLLKVDFHVPEIYLSQISKGQTIEVIFDGLPGQLFTGQVIAIQPHADDNHSFKVRGLLDNKGHTLKPGLFVRVNLTVANTANALLVPEHAIVLSAQGPYLYRVNEGKAEKVMVQTGLRKPGWVEITQGIEANDLIIISGQNKIYPEALVAPISD